MKTTAHPLFSFSKESDMAQSDINPSRSLGVLQPNSEHV